MTGDVVHATPNGLFVVARRLRDGRYAVPVHAALWNVFGHVRVGPLPEVFMVGYTYANPANARNRARSLYPMG